MRRGQSQIGEPPNTKTPGAAAAPAPRPRFALDMRLGRAARTDPMRADAASGHVPFKDAKPMTGQKIRQPSNKAVTRARPAVPRLRAESGSAILVGRTTA